MEFQVISWEGPTHDEDFLIHMFGRCMDGKSVHLEVPWKPYFFVKGNLGGGLPIVTRKDLWGFQAGKKQVFTQIECNTLKDFRMRQKRYAGKVYEGNLDPILRFMHRTGIHSTGWVRVEQSEPASYESTCDINITAKWDTLKPFECDLMAPFRMCSIDIECYSENGQFPDSMKPSDVCFQIAMTTRVNSVEMDTRCFGVKTEFQTERSMLEAFAKHFKNIDPDVVTGWNIFGFDLEYIYNRMCLCKCSDMILGRLYDSPIEMNYKKLSSSALGNNTLKIMRLLGRYTFDMYHEVKREHKFESYSLNNVSKIVLGDKKNDMPVHEIFSRFKSGEGLQEVAEYCIKDTELPHAICEKLSMFQNLVEMAKACWVPLSFLSERGQQIKVFSQMAQAARELGFMIPVLPKSPEGEGGYQGATVLEAQTGAYYEPITGLDFASLYPSIMCAHNLCYSTLVLDPQYLGLEGVKYETFGPHTFATEMNGKPTESLLPKILVNLKKHRKLAKTMMAQKPEMYNIYNGKQLAYKISMNSVYGFTGALNGILPQVAIAATVTLRGRQMIEESKEYVEKNFPGAKVRYGDTDSIMVQFAVEGTIQEKIAASWQLGEKASKEISSLFPPPHSLELEKVYWPYVLYSKKRYAAKLWTMGSDGTMKCADKLDVKGLQTVRRDSCPFARRILTDILDATMVSSDPSAAIKIAKDARENLLGGKVDNEELIITKNYRGDDYKSKMPHVTVVEKMKGRNPGSEPQVGTRVPFIIIKNNEKLMSDKAEDPVWAQEHNLPIDYVYYFEHQLEKPICDLLGPHVGSGFSIFEKTKTRRITDFFIKK
jgi:DNA polymerase delta subunit 1